MKNKVKQEPITEDERKLADDLESAEYLHCEFSEVHDILKALLLILDHTRNLVGDDREVIIAAFRPILSMEVQHIGCMAEHQKGRIEYLTKELTKKVKS